MGYHLKDLVYHQKKIKRFLRGVTKNIIDMIKCKGFCYTFVSFYCEFFLSQLKILKYRMC